MPKFPDKNRPIVMRKVNLVTIEEIDMEAAHSFAKQVKLILHTCNQNEYWAALEKLEPPTKEDGSKIGDFLINYPPVDSVIGCFANCKAAVVRTKQGNECRDELRDALTKSFPKCQAIIGAGIAYANDRKRKFADVLISDQIENFVKTRVEDDGVMNYGPREQIDFKVRRVFENRARDWSDFRSFLCTDDRISVAHIGCIVSAPTLIRNEKLRDQLMKHTPYAIGGEMEGWVLLELRGELRREERAIEVIIIKGVADYGDLSKGDEWQWTAAKAAMNYIHYCLKEGGSIFHGKEV